MSTHISWSVELALKAGAFDDFQALTKEMIKLAQREQGVIIYERFESEDGKTIYVYERYVDSEAAVSHLRAFEESFSTQFQKLVERKRFTVFGTPSEELRRILDRYGVTYAIFLDGVKNSTG